MLIDKFKLVSSGPNGDVYDYIGETVDVSANSQSIALLDCIQGLLETINCSNVEGYGTLSDYKDLFELANYISKLKLNLNLDNIQDVATKANQITLLINSLTLRLTSLFELSLFSLEDLITIKNALNSILHMFESIEEFIETINIQYPYVMEMQRQNQIYLDSISHCIENVYYKLDNVFTHDNTIHFIPDYMTKLVPPIQGQVNRFCDYHYALANFTQSIGIQDECSSSTDDC
jgi:hypothetical protein